LSIFYLKDIGIVFAFKVFQKTSMSEIVRKSRILTGYLEARIIAQYGYPDRQKQFNQISAQNGFNQTDPNGTQSENGVSNGTQIENDGKKHVYVEIFTPSNPDERGAQLSLSFNINITQVFEELTKRGVVVCI